MSSTLTGRSAESAAAAYLESKGYKIIERNWRTRFCEIDIVAHKDKRYYFVEVKFRSSQSQGSGFEYITPKKLQQMTFAATLWVQSHHHSGDYTLSAIEIGGHDYSRFEFIEDLTG